MRCVAAGEWGRGGRGGGCLEEGEGGGEARADVAEEGGAHGRAELLQDPQLVVERRRVPVARHVEAPDQPLHVRRHLRRAPLAARQQRVERSEAGTRKAGDGRGRAAVDAKGGAAP
jgi:hypothetical protein